MSEASPKKPKKSTQPKVFDVTRPGKVQPSASSRPLIVGHKPQVKDDTLTDAPQAMADPLDRPLLKHATAAIESSTAPLLPAKEQRALAEKATATTPSDTAGAPATSGAPITAQPEPQTQQPAATPTSVAPPDVPIETEPTTTLAEPLSGGANKSAESENNVISAETALGQPVDGSTPDSVEPSATQGLGQPSDSSSIQPPSSAPVPVEDDGVIDAHVDKSSIVVSHHRRAPSGRHIGKWIAWLLVLVLLAVGVAYVLYDAGIIHANLNLPHTGLFKKKSNTPSGSSNTTPTSANHSSKSSTTQPSAALTGYTQYKNQDLGFAFAYPKSWGSLTESTAANDTIVLSAATADVTTPSKNELSGKLALLVSKKPNYQLVASTNGPTVQPTNQGGTYTWKVTAVGSADANTKVGDTYSAVIARKSGSLTIFDFSLSGTCTQKRWVFEASGGYVEIDAPKLCPASGASSTTATAQSDYASTAANILNSIATL